MLGGEAPAHGPWISLYPSLSLYTELTVAMRQAPAAPPLLQICIVASALVVAAFMVLLQVPGQSSAVLLPLLALTWAATFPLAVVAQVRSLGKNS